MPDFRVGIQQLLDYPDWVGSGDATSEHIDTCHDGLIESGVQFLTIVSGYRACHLLPLCQSVKNACQHESD